MRRPIAIWLGLIVAGFAGWEAYDTTPGRSEWTTNAVDNAPRLQVFLHPHCPCSRATLAELRELLAEGGSPRGVEIVFVRPDGVPADWEKTDLWNEATLAGCNVVSDPEGNLARQAGAATSGEVIARDVAGRIAFRGGITRARGVRGGNPGRAAVLDVLAGRTPEMDRTPVYGCPLLDR